MGVGQQLSSSKPRYRFEGGRWCIDLKLKSARHLFDNRDPAPFRERELDSEAVEYVLTSVAEIGKQPLSLVLTFEEQEATLPPEVVKDAIAAHLRYEIEKAGLRLSTHWRRTRYLLITGLSVLVLFLFLAELAVSKLAEGPIRQILREGLVITGWVAMWRPLEALLYDWWPLIRHRWRLQQIAAADVVINVTQP